MKYIVSYLHWLTAKNVDIPQSTCWYCKKKHTRASFELEVSQRQKKSWSGALEGKKKKFVVQHFEHAGKELPCVF